MARKLYDKINDPGILVDRFFEMLDKQPKKYKYQTLDMLLYV